METAMELVGILLVLSGTALFTAGTVGLVRFPDIANRLHALTKADNLGLSLVLAGVALLLGSWGTAGVLLLTWVMALAAASVSARVLGGIAAGEQTREQTAVQEESAGSAPGDSHRKGVDQGGAPHGG